jgi:Kef-type K+ transport system membrane component KefB
MLIAATHADAVFGRLLVALVVTLLAARLAGGIARRLGQPVVIGEIVAGIALGPSVLGLVGAGLPNRLFPTEIRPYLSVVAEVGLVLFMFLVGLEVDIASMRASGRRAATISLSSIVVPFALGIGVLAPVLFGSHHVVEGKAVRFAPFALFIGVSMCGTAFAVLARVLAEQNLLRTRLGALLISCAAIDDIVAFAMLGVVAAIAAAHSAAGVAISLAALLGFIAVLFAVVRPLLARTLARTHRRSLSADQLGVLILGAFAGALVTSRIGLHPMMGAFLFGVAVPRSSRPRLAHEVTERLETVSVHILMPVFFVVTGLGVDVRRLGVTNIAPTLLILALACVGKFVGGAGAARLCGVETREAMAIGTMMNTRGLAELVILNVGRSIGVLDDQMFTMLVLMAIVTTVMAGPLLQIIYPDRLRSVVSVRRDLARAA